MKGCLVIVGFLMCGLALMVGTVVVVEKVGASKNEPLTSMTSEFEITSYESKTHGSAGRTVQGAEIEYRYRADGQWYAYTSPVWKSLNALQDKVVCFDPDDPGEHVIRGYAKATCGEGNRGTVRRAEPVAP
jgi:hypothetical protein